jgi:hypothetical protein
MFVAQEMEQPVDEEKLDFAAGGMPRLRSLAHGRRHRNDDITKDIRLNVRKLSFPQGEGKHVGSSVPAAVPPVQGTHRTITDKENAQLGIMKADAPQQVPELYLERRRCQPLLLLSIFYPDVHRVSFLQGNSSRGSRSDDGICR